jgi:hypothetical protein
LDLLELLEKNEHLLFPHLHVLLITVRAFEIYAEMQVAGIMIVDHVLGKIMTRLFYGYAIF